MIRKKHPKLEDNTMDQAGNDKVSVNVERGLQIIDDESIVQEPAAQNETTITPVEKMKVKRKYTKHREIKEEGMRKKVRRRIFWLAFAILAPPIFVSSVSIFHSYDLLQAANATPLAAMLAIAYELMVICLLVLATAMKQLGKWVRRWSYVLTVLLAFFLAFANVYVAWITIPDQVILNIARLTTLPETGFVTKRIVSMFLGGLITLMSLSFVPIFIKYREKAKEIAKAI